MASIRQRHHSVPTSNSPPIPEWADHFWYVMRVAALQASDKLSDEEVTTLIQSFHAYGLTLPCPKCREHYVADWASFPFTAEHAKSALAAMKWVEDLRIRIEERKRSEGHAPVPEPTAEALAATAAIVPPAIRAAAPTRSFATPAAASRAASMLRQGRVGTPGFVTPTVSSVQAAQAQAQAQITASRAAGGIRSVSGDAMKRTVAIQSALQQTTANRAGPRGCNCGKRR